MSLQFVFGNPIRRKKKKTPNPKQKGKSMAKKGRKKAKSRANRLANPKVHFFRDKRGALHEIGVSLNDKDLAQLRASEKSLGAELDVSEKDMEQAIAELIATKTANYQTDTKKKKLAAIKKILKNKKTIGKGLMGKISRAIGDPSAYESYDIPLTDDELLRIAKKGNPMKRRHRKHENPTIGDVDGVLASNPRKKKRKASKKRKTTKRKTTRKATTRRRKRKSWFSVISKPKKGSKRSFRHALKMAGKKKKGSKAVVSYKGYKIRRNPIGADLKSMVPKLGVAAVAGALIVASNKYALPMLAKVPVVGPLLNNKMAAPLVTAIPPSIAGIALLWLGDKQNNRMMKDIGEALLVASATAVGAGYANRLLPGGGMSGVDLTGVDMYGLPEMGATDFGDDVGDEYGDEYGDEVGATDFGATDFGATDFGETVGETVGDEYGDEYGDEVGDDYSGVELSGVSLMG